MRGFGDRLRNSKEARVGLTGVWSRFEGSKKSEQHGSVHGALPKDGLVRERIVRHISIGLERIERLADVIRNQRKSAHDDRCGGDGEIANREMMPDLARKNDYGAD